MEFKNHMDNGSQASDSWEVFTMVGSQAKLRRGVASTVDMPHDYPQGCFSGTTTIILGATAQENHQLSTETVAAWHIPVDEYWASNLDRCYLVISCIRYFGGLHTRKYGSRVDITVNERNIDSFSLMIIPENHTDYFHRIATPPLPDVSPISKCQTVYVWPLQEEYVRNRKHQTITLRIDNAVRWDIDYLSILFRIPHGKQPQTDLSQTSVFISHASEDKSPFVRLLAEALRHRGLQVWYDEFSLRVGDSLRRSIDKGLNQCRYAVVIISPSFLRKEWPQRELDGLIQGRKAILPVWHNITLQEVRNYSLTLADRIATCSSKGIGQVVDDLIQAIESGPEPD